MGNNTIGFPPMNGTTAVLPGVTMAPTFPPVPNSSARQVSTNGMLSEIIAVGTVGLLILLMR